MSTYCQAHELGELRGFAGWGEERGADLDPGTVCYLWSDLAVRRGAIDPDTVLGEPAPAGWPAFCRNVLSFAPPAFDRPAWAPGPADGAARVPFTSGQRWLLDEREATHPRRFTLRAVLPVERRMEPRAVERALAGLLERHDALRLRLDRVDGEWVQAVSDEPGVPLAWVRLERLAPAAAAAARRAACLEASLMVGRLREPMLRAVYLEGGDGDRLFLVLDHFVGDGMALAVLLSELRRLLEAAAAGREPALPPVPSFRAWATRLAEHVSSPEVEREVDDYWLALPWDRMRPLPLDMPDGVVVDAASGRLGYGLQSSERMVTGMLDAEETEGLIARTRGRAHEPHDLLLTAVLVALGGHTGCPVHLIMDNHLNRFPAFAGLDMSRSVACVAGARRMVLDLGGARTAEEALRAVAAQLRAMPNLGRTLEWLIRRGDGREVPAVLRPISRVADVTILYNGRLDRWVAAGVGGGLGEALPELDRLNDLGLRVHPFNCNAVIDLDGRFRVDLLYSEQVHRRETAESLLDRCLACLRDLSRAPAPA